MSEEIMPSPGTAPQDLCADAQERSPRLFRIGRKRYFVVGDDFIQRVRPYGDERISGLPADEIAWATRLSRAKALFLWHRDHGLHRGEPHPMGKDLAAKRAHKDHHAERYREAGFALARILTISRDAKGRQTEAPHPVIISARTPAEAREKAQAWWDAEIAKERLRLENASAAILKRAARVQAAKAEGK